jgi:regulator of RNase E activity RraB
MLDEAQIQEGLAGHAARNAELLRNLRDKGVSLDAPQFVEHHFWAKGQRNAALLAKALYDRGYLVLVISPEEDDSGLWDVEAGIEQSLAEAADPALTEELTRLAAQFDGVYDGWGVSVEPSATS